MSTNPELPPDGEFPATIRYQKSGDRVVLQFHVAFPGGVFTHERRLKPGSDEGRKFITTLRKHVGPWSDVGDDELDGEKINVAGESRLLRGKLTWIVQRFKPAGPQKVVASEHPPGVHPDEHDDLADKMVSQLLANSARFIWEGEKMLILKQGENPIPIDYKTLEYAKLQHAYTGFGTAEPKGKILLQRVQFRAFPLAAKHRRVLFSFADNKQVLVPVEGGKVLRIAAEGVAIVENGAKELWLEHPRGTPLPWQPDPDSREGLEKFEELLLQTQAIPITQMQILLGMAVGIVPFLRQLVPTRPVIEIAGRGGHGKTTGAARFLTLLRLGKVQGDYSLALTKRDGDVGLLVRDNVEAGDLTRLIEGFFLFGATEAEWGRVGAGRNAENPIIVVTTVEGIARRSEMNRRLFRFDFHREKKPWPEASISTAIETHRALIFRGIAEVLRHVIAQSPPAEPKVIPMPDFTDYCGLAYRVLRAWEDVAGKQAGFADDIFEAWNRPQCADEVEDFSAGPYPRLLEAVIARCNAADHTDPVYGSMKIERDYTWGNHKGQLVIATPNGWLTALKDVAARGRDHTGLPENPEGLQRRLKELDPDEHGYKFLTKQEEKNLLARTGKRRLWGVLEVS